MPGDDKTPGTDQVTTGCDADIISAGLSLSPLVSQVAAQAALRKPSVQPSPAAGAFHRSLDYNHHS